MWTYRIDDADNEEIVGVAATIDENSKLSINGYVSQKVKASGTVYVLMDSTGQDWAWLPVSTNRNNLLKWAERNSD